MSKKIKSVWDIFIPGVIIMFFMIPLLSFAQTGGDPNPSGGNPAPVSINIKIDNPFKQDTIEGLINTILNEILIPIGGVIAVMMIMYAGYLFVTARGSDTQITKAKQALLYAVIGAAILLGAKVLSDAILSTINQLRAP